MNIKAGIWNWVEPHIRLPVAGLDISDRTVKYLAFGTGKKTSQIAAFGAFDVPEGLIVNGEIKKEDELINVFSSWRAKERKIAKSFFVVSLPEEKSFLQIIQLPNMREDEVKNAMRWEIEANIPLAFEDIIYDYEIIESFQEGLDHLDIMVVAFPRAIVESYVRVLTRAGISIFALELESQAIVRSSVPILRAPSACIVVDIGRTRTSFIVFAGGSIVFTTTIELGGRLFEEHISKALGVSMEEAKNLKKNIGLNKKAENADLFHALVPTMTVLADELRRVTEYYHNHAGHTHGIQDGIQSVLLVGGDGNLFGLETYLSSALKIPVQAADPFISLRTEGSIMVPPVPKNESLSFATVLGLALRGIRYTQ